MRTFWEPQATNREMDAVARVIASGYWNDGPEVLRFEKALAKRIGVEHVICCSSGTAALFLALRGMDIGRHDLVSVPDITFIATANAVALTGADVRLGRPHTTSAWVGVNVSGRIADGPMTVEDSCEAFPHTPTAKVACYSFSPNKIITTGQGGCVATNDDRLAADIRALKDQGRYGGGTGGDDDHPIIGFNFKMTDLQAAVGLAQLQDLDRRIDRRREIQAMYERDLPGIIPFKSDEVPLWTDMACRDNAERENVIAAIEKSGFQCRRFWKPLSQQPPYLDPTMKTDTSNLMWLPSSFAMTNDEVHAVINAAAQAYMVAS